MIGRRLLSGFLLICLPAAFATLLSVAGYLKLVPLYEEEDRDRVFSAYRRVAENLQDDPQLGAGAVPAKRGTWRTLKPGRWGYIEKDGEATVWYSEGVRVQSVTTPRVEPFPVSMLLLTTMGLSLTLFWTLTLAGCWTFRNSVKERDDFVAATAHDLTTPLVSLRRLIGRDDVEAKVLAERMMRLVKNLTDFLKLGGRRPGPELRPVDLRKAYEEAYALFRDDYRWHFGGKDVATEGPAALMAEADETMTVQILWNLLANDLKYAAPCGSVAVRFAASGAFVTVSFADTGRGLPAAERKRIFDRYYRVQSVMTSGKGGFGIGLCTAREFARAMGGDLTVAANEPQGCVFTLKLRRAK